MSLNFRYEILISEPLTLRYCLPVKTFHRHYILYPYSICFEMILITGRFFLYRHAIYKSHILKSVTLQYVVSLLRRRFLANFQQIKSVNLAVCVRKKLLSIINPACVTTVHLPTTNGDEKKKIIINTNYHHYRHNYGSYNNSKSLHVDCVPRVIHFKRIHAIAQCDVGNLQQ